MYTADQHLICNDLSRLKMPGLAVILSASVNGASVVHAEISSHELGWSFIIVSNSNLDYACHDWLVPHNDTSVQCNQLNFEFIRHIFPATAMCQSVQKQIAFFCGTTYSPVRPLSKLAYVTATITTNCNHIHGVDVLSVQFTQS